jgi:hypothetical protein
VDQDQSKVKQKTLSKKQLKQKKAGDVAQVAEYLPNKCIQTPVVRRKKKRFASITDLTSSPDHEFCYWFLFEKTVKMGSDDLGTGLPPNSIQIGYIIILYNH